MMDVLIAYELPAPTGTCCQMYIVTLQIKLYNKQHLDDVCEFCRKTREIGIPNNRRISVLTIYLTNLVYWVGSVTGISFTTHLRIVNVIDCLTFGENKTLSLGCYF